MADALTPESVPQPEESGGNDMIPQPARRWYARRLKPLHALVLLGLSVAVIGGYSTYWYQVNFPYGQAPSPVGLGVLASFGHTEGTCLVPEDEIRAGGPPKDGIPSLTDPKMIGVSEMEKMNPDDRIITVEFHGEARAYPIRILNFHEAVNDTVGGRPILVTYCPLCDSALVFDRRIGGEEREFGISGLLYNSNVLLYDRQSSSNEESLWSQMLMKAVCGPAAEKGLELELLPSGMATWGQWSAANPTATVLSFDTKHSRNYTGNPYTRYFETDHLMFPADVEEEALDGLPRKEFTVIVEAGEQLKGYPLSRLKEAAGEDLVYEDMVGGVPVRLTITDPEQGTVDVEAAEEGQERPSVAYAFWFVFRAMHPDAAYLENV